MRVIKKLAPKCGTLFLFFTLFIAGAQLQGCAVAAVSGAASGVAIVHDRRTAGTIMDDQAIELKAANALTKNNTLWKLSHISTLSYNNVLLLVGQAPTEELKQQALDAVSNIPKVRQIHNEIIVGENAPIAMRGKDSWITAQIKGKMVGTKGFNASRVKVVTEQGVVYLMGLTTREEELIATEIAQEVTGVNKVVQIFEHLDS
jgi:osmotically-inducible protein OsmY